MIWATSSRSLQSTTSNTARASEYRPPLELVFNCGGVDLPADRPLGMLGGMCQFVGDQPQPCRLLRSELPFRKGDTRRLRLGPGVKRTRRGRSRRFGVQAHVVQIGVKPRLEERSQLRHQLLAAASRRGTFFAVQVGSPGLDLLIAGPFGRIVAMTQWTFRQWGLARSRPLTRLPGTPPAKVT